MSAVRTGDQMSVLIWISGFLPESFVSWAKGAPAIAIEQTFEYARALALEANGRKRSAIAALAFRSAMVGPERAASVDPREEQARHIVDGWDVAAPHQLLGASPEQRFECARCSALASLAEARSGIEQASAKHFLQQAELHQFALQRSPVCGKGNRIFDLPAVPMALAVALEQIANAVEACNKDGGVQLLKRFGEPAGVGEAPECVEVAHAIVAPTRDFDEEALPYVAAKTAQGEVLTVDHEHELRGLTMASEHALCVLIQRIAGFYSAARSDAFVGPLHLLCEGTADQREAYEEVLKVLTRAEPVYISNAIGEETHRPCLARQTLTPDDWAKVPFEAGADGWNSYLVDHRGQASLLATYELPFDDEWWGDDGRKGLPSHEELREQVHDLEAEIRGRPGIHEVLQADDDMPGRMVVRVAFPLREIRGRAHALELMEGALRSPDAATSPQSTPVTSATPRMI